MRSTILETYPDFQYTVLTNTITGVAGANTIACTAVGTDYTGFPSTGWMVGFVDDGGKWQQYAVIAVAANQLTLDRNLRTSVTALAGWHIGAPDFPIFLQGDPAMSTMRPNRYPFYMALAAPLYAAVNRQTGGTKDKFGIIDPQEGVNLETIYLSLPYQYTLGDTQIGFQFWYQTTGGLSESIPGLGKLGREMVNVENIEVPVNEYIQPPTAVASLANDYSAGWYLGVNIMNVLFSPNDSELTLDIDDSFGQDFPCASPLDEPSAVAGQVFPARIGARIKHDAALT